MRSAEPLVAGYDFRIPRRMRNESTYVSEKQEISAGRAFLEAAEVNPQERRRLAAALARVRMFARYASTVRSPHRIAVEAIHQILTAVDEAENEAPVDLSDVIRAGLSTLRTEHQELFADLEREAAEGLEAVNDELASFGFEPPANRLESWEALARIVEKDPGPMTAQEIYNWAVAWIRRELLRRKMDRGELPIQSTTSETAESTPRTPDEAGIRPDEHDASIACCVGKRIYLGHDTQVSRLFWLLATPPGRARTLGEVQRSVDGVETPPDMDHDEFRKASQRVRKAISKLRKRLMESGADQHLIINRGGTQQEPEWTMLPRFGS